MLYEAGHPKPVPSDTLERWVEEGGGRGFKRERMYVYLSIADSP